MENAKRIGVNLKVDNDWIYPFPTIFLPYNVYEKLQSYPTILGIDKGMRTVVHTFRREQ